MNSQYAYLLVIEGQPPVIFTWATVVKKYIRDTWGAENISELPPGYLTLHRHKVNPKAGQAVVINHITDIARFIAGTSAT